MNRTRIILPLLMIAMGAGVAEAQFSRTGRPVQRLDRWLGVGNGPGYHWQNPGPDSSYYNPWSPNNSSLVSPYNPAPPVNLRFHEDRSGQNIPQDEVFQYPAPFDFVPEPPVISGNGIETGDWNGYGSTVNSFQPFQAPAPVRARQPVSATPMKSASPAPTRPTSAGWPAQPPLTIGHQ